MFEVRTAATDADTAIALYERQHRDAVVGLYTLNPVDTVRVVVGGGGGGGGGGGAGDDNRLCANIVVAVVMVA
jgi:hypothetical protein